MKISSRKIDKRNKNDELEENKKEMYVPSDVCSLFSSVSKS